MVHVRVAGGLRARVLVVAVRERLGVRPLCGGEPDDRARAADVRLAGGDGETLRRVVEVGGGVDVEVLVEVGLGQAREVGFQGCGDVASAGESLVGRRTAMFALASGIRCRRKATNLMIDLPINNRHVSEVAAQYGDCGSLGEELAIEDRVEGLVRPRAVTGYWSVNRPMWLARGNTYKLYMTRSCARARALTSAARRQAIFAATEPEPQPACSA